VKILVVRLDGIGDALACVPLLEALRTAGHQLGMALSDRNADLFAPGMLWATHVLERIPWPAHGSTQTSRARADAEIAAADYDVALVASEEPEAYELARPIPRRIGFSTGWAKPLKTLSVRQRLTDTLVRPATSRAQRRHEVEEIFRLGAGLVGSVSPSRDPAQLRHWIRAEGLPQRYGLLVQLGAKWQSSGVALPVLRRVVAVLQARAARFVVAPQEREALSLMLPDLAFEVPADTADWIGKIDAAAALVTVDTGAAHVAGTLGVPLVDVFPDADFEHQTRRWRPWAAPSITLRAGELTRAPETLIGQALDAL
jgi:ADP-heptose:LPS heptosyltransferase